MRLPTWEALRSVYTINISQGGMRLSVGARAPLGTAIDIILTLPDGTRLHLPGKVAHLGPDESGDIGVRFDDLPAAHAERRSSCYIKRAGGRAHAARPRRRAFLPGCS